MKTIGVTTFDPWFYLDDIPILNDLIYFDHLVYETPVLESNEKFCATFPNGQQKFNARLKEIEKLEKVGLVSKYDHEKFKTKPISSKPRHYYSNTFKSIELSGEFLNEMKSKPKTEVTTKFMAKFLQRYRDCTDLDSRAHSALLNTFNDDFYFPICRSSEPINPLIGEGDKTSSTIKTVLKKFPVITNTIEIEKLIEFKQDADTKIKLGRLRNWVLEISKTDYSEKEIHQKLEYLLSEYSNQLELHRLKHNLGSIEIFLVTTAEIIENIARFKFSKAAKALFDINRKDIMLLEEEEKFVGKELALIHHLRNKNGL